MTFQDYLDDWTFGVPLKSNVVQGVGILWRVWYRPDPSKPGRIVLFADLADAESFCMTGCR